MVLDNFSLKAQSFANAPFSVSSSFIHYFLNVSETPTLKPFQIRGSATPGRITDTPFQHGKGNDTNHNTETFHSRQALSTEQTLSSTLQRIWCLSLRGATQLLRENSNSNRNYRVLIQYSEGRQAFSSQTTILRNIISPVKLLKGKNPVFMVCPSCLQLFPSCEQSKTQFQLCVSGN